MGTSTNFKIEGYKDIKNYIHNYLGLTKDEVMSIIKETLAKSVREEITKILNDETRLRILINDCISREISNQSKERRCYIHSMMDEIYKRIDEEIHKQVTDRLLISLKEDKESDKKPIVVSNGEMISIKGKNFHCTCGANVFTRYDDDTFVCNSCGNEYQGKCNQ